MALFDVTYELYHSAGDHYPVSEVVEATTWARAVQQTVESLEGQLEAGDVHNYCLAGLSGPIWGVEPDESE